MAVNEKLRAMFEWYLENQDTLIEKYNGKVLVIKDFSVVGAFDEEIKAYFYGKENFGMGNFIIQRCTSGQEAYVAHIYTPFIVSF